MLTLCRPAAILALIASIPMAAHAQNSGTSYNVAAGLSLATGTFGDRNDAGYNVTVGIGVRQPGTSLGFRVEGLYNEFNQVGASGASHAGGVMLSGLYDLMPASAKQSGSLYGIGGIGYYSTREPYFGAPAQSNFGWNIGAGFRFPLSGFSAYVEARYHSVSNADVTFLPLTFGLVF